MADENKYTFKDGLRDLLFDQSNLVEQIPVGPNESERNDSRLDSMTLDTKRPVADITKEVLSNLTPRAINFLAGLGVGKKVAKKTGESFSKALGTMVEKSGADDYSKGVKKVINQVIPVVTKANPEADEVAKATKNSLKDKAVENLEKVVKDADTIGDLDKGIKTGKFQELDPKEITKQKDNILKGTKAANEATDKLTDIAKNPISKLYNKNYDSLEDTFKSIHDIYYDKYAKTATGRKRPEKTIELMINRDKEYLKALDDVKSMDFNKRVAKQASDKGKFAAAVTVASKPALHTASKITDLDNGKRLDGIPKAWDPRLEGKGTENMDDLAKDILDINNMDPKKYNMDDITTLLERLNHSDDGLGKYWNPGQISSLSDNRKVKVYNEIAKGLYDDFENGTPSYELRDLLRQLREEQNKEVRQRGNKKNSTNNKENK